MNDLRFNHIANRLKLALVAVGLVLLSSIGARAADVKVIANSSVSAASISSGDLQSVFLLDKDTIGGGHVLPVLSKGGAAHESFIKTYLGKNDSALQAYYRSLVFTGKGSMPKTLSSDAEVVAYVAKTKGAIGYVGSGASTEGVKTLQVR
jgi:hypothetical protein